MTANQSLIIFVIGECILAINEAMLLELTAKLHYVRFEIWKFMNVSLQRDFLPNIFHPVQRFSSKIE